MRKQRIRVILLYWDIAGLVLTTLAIFAMFELLVKPIMVDAGIERMRIRFLEADARFSAGIRFLEDRPYLPYKENLDLILDSLGRSTAARLPYDRSLARLNIGEHDSRTTLRAGQVVAENTLVVEQKTTSEGRASKGDLEKRRADTGPETSLIRFSLGGQPYVGIEGLLYAPVLAGSGPEDPKRIRIRLLVADHEADFFFRIHRARTVFFTILGLILIILLLGRLSTTRTVTREIHAIEERIRKEGETIRTRGLVGTELTGVDLGFRDTDELYSSFVDLNGRLVDLGEIIGGIADPELFAAVLKGDRSLLEPHEAWMTVLFLDVRGFTTIAEKRKQDAMRVINHIWQGTEEVVAAHGGKINKYMGDAALILFPSDPAVPQRTSAVAALQSILDLLRAVPDLENRLDIDFSFRIGADCGPVVYGKTGSDRNYELGVIGDPVNTAARLEALNKQYGTTLLMTDRVTSAAGIGPQARFEAQGEAPLLPFRIDRARPKGKTEARDLYTLVSLTQDAGRFLGGCASYPREAFVRYAKLSGACAMGLAAWREGDGSKGPRLWATLAREAARLDVQHQFPGTRAILCRLVTEREFIEYESDPSAWIAKPIFEVARPDISWLEYGAVELEK